MRSERYSPPAIKIYTEIHTTQQQKQKNKGVFALTLEPDNGHRTMQTEPRSNQFEQPELQQLILEAEADFAAGKHTIIKDPKNIWERTRLKTRRLLAI